jgi:hypothetical protein
MTLRGDSDFVRFQSTEAARPPGGIEKEGGSLRDAGRPSFFGALPGSRNEAAEDRGEPLRDAGAVVQRDAARTNRGLGRASRAGAAGR